MKVLFTSNIPSPYRVDFFNELGKLCDLTVVFERRSSAVRNSEWLSTGAKTYREEFLTGIPTGEAEAISLGLIKYVKERSFDKIVIGMYSSPSAMIAIEYMRLHHIPFYLSTDGGFIKSESGIAKSVKSHFISSARYWFSPSDKATEYLIHYGADKSRICKYPFTSLTQNDLLRADCLRSLGKKDFRKNLGIEEDRVLLSVGRFSYLAGYGKGYDTLMRAAESLSPDVGIYIVGDEPTEEFIRWKAEHRLDHVHFVGFQKKEELAEYYAAADAFILLTRGDAWGLVINEAMSFSLPVITTRQCMAGLELVREGKNGFLIDADDTFSAVSCIRSLFSSGSALSKMGYESRNVIGAYTVENMARTHYSLFQKSSNTEEATNNG